MTSTIPVSSDKLYEFYSKWLAAATAAEDDYSEAYCRKYDVRTQGLCYSPVWDLGSFDDRSSKAKLCIEMGEQFMRAGLDQVSPFNEYLGDYFDECHKATAHLNPARLAWVRARIADYEESKA